MNIPRISLNRISSWANAVSWIVLVVQVIYFVGGIIIETQSGGYSLPTEGNFVPSRTNLFSMMFALSPLVSGAAFFIILQAISAGATSLLEIEKRSDDAYGTWASKLSGCGEC